MRFPATVIFEFSARDVGEAGERLNGLLARAAEHHMDTRSLELSTPPGTPVLPRRGVFAALEAGATRRCCAVLATRAITGAA